MSTLEELRQQAAAAKARKASAALSEDEAERAKLLAEMEADLEEARAAEKAKRELDGKAREDEARKKAGGKYLVKFFDLGSLLPDADAATLPGGGVLVLRSPPTHPIDALGHFYREVEAKQRPLPDVYADLACESVVYPDTANGAEGSRLRAFFESSLGKGTVIPVGDAVTDLGGVRTKATKRGRG